MTLDNTTPEQDFVISQAEAMNNGTVNALISILESFDARLTAALTREAELRNEVEAAKDTANVLFV